MGFIKCPPKDFIIKKNDEFIKIIDEIVNTLNKSAYKYAYQAKSKYKTQLDNFFKQYYDELKKNKYIDDSAVKLYTISTQAGDVLPDHIRALTTQGANFYPTPFVCLEKFRDRIEQSKDIFEGTAGLGHILNGVRKIFKNSNQFHKNDYTLQANEYDKIFCSFLSIMNPDCEIIQGDYLELKLNQLKPFDCIILNPPFTRGTNKNFYFDFLFKSLKLANDKKNDPRLNKGVYITELIFISPPIYNQNKYNQDIFYPDDVKDYMPKKLYNELENTYGSIYEDCTFLQGDLIGHCSEFIATKFKADMYLLSI